MKTVQIIQDPSNRPASGFGIDGFDSKSSIDDHCGKKLIDLVNNVEECGLEVKYIKPCQRKIDPCLVRIFCIEQYQSLLNPRFIASLEELNKKKDSELSIGLFNFPCAKQYPDSIFLFDDVFNGNQDPGDIVKCIQRRLLQKQDKSISRIDEKLIKKFAHLNLVGQSKAHLSVLKKVDKISNYFFAPVLIEGETGTGKENVSRAIHYLSERRDNGFFPVNCGAIPDSLFESELFGHEKGAFTNAYQKQAGLIELADNGTLFLDEVDSLSGKGQAALLRFLQTGEYRSLGSRTIKNSSVRIISASNVSLDELVEKNEFREDLLFRLNVFNLKLPALRERKDDVEVIAKFLLDKFSKNHSIERKMLHPSTLNWLTRQRWQGNIRELENTLLREFLLSDSSILRFGSDQALTPDGISAQPGEEDLLDFQSAKAKNIRSFEKNYVKSMLARTLGNVSEAARLAGKERRSFGKLIKKYNINRSSYE